MKGSWKGVVDGSLVIAAVTALLYLFGAMYFSYFYGNMGVPLDLVDINLFELMSVGGLYAFEILLYFSLFAFVALAIYQIPLIKKIFSTEYPFNQFWWQWLPILVLISILYLASNNLIERRAKESALSRLEHSPRVEVITKSSRVFPEDLRYVAYGKGNYIFFNQPKENDSTLQVVVVPADDVKSLLIYTGLITAKTHR